jgi:hypothetical protein
MSPIEIGGLVATIVTPLSALLVFAIKSFTNPLRVAVDNSTSAMIRLMTITDEHGIKLEEHGNRLSCIDERHRIEDREART